MVERDGEEARLTAVLKAAGDPSRRRILALLVRDGPQRVTALAAAFELSLNAVSKHIRVLEAAGLVTRQRAWRDHVIRAELSRLEEVERWFAALRWVEARKAERRGEEGGSADPAEGRRTGPKSEPSAGRPEREGA